MYSYEVDEGWPVKKIRAAVPARDEASDTMVPIGWVLRPLRNNARPARGRGHLEVADDRIPRGATSGLSMRT